MANDAFTVLFDPLSVDYSANDKVAMVDGDSSEHFPNLALQKISAWEKRNGVENVKLIKLKHQRRNGVLVIHPDSIKQLEAIKGYDRIYASFVFTRSKPIAAAFGAMFPNAYLGGTGVDVYHEKQEGELRAQPKMITKMHDIIDDMYPDHNLYESEHADANVAFWSDPKSFKYPKKYSGYVESYAISPKDESINPGGSSHNQSLLERFDSLMEHNGYESGAEYRGSTRGVGYSSKGCVRRCTFCVVPIIQGAIVPQYYGIIGVINWILPRKFHPTMSELVDLYKAGRLKMRPHVFWDNQGKIKRVSSFLTISDNNFPADPTCLEKMDYMIENNIAVNLNQGMDARLLTAKSRTDKDGVYHPSGDEICERLAKMHFLNFKGTARQLHFAWDFIGVGRIVLEGLNKLVNQYGLKYSYFMVYCLSGFNTTFEQDYQRVITIAKTGADPYIMLFRNVDGSEGLMHDGTPQDWRLKYLTRWCNNKFVFGATPFEKYDMYVKELSLRSNGTHTEELDRIAALEVFDWLTDDYINHA